MKHPSTALMTLTAVSQLLLVVIKGQQPRITNGQAATPGSYPWFAFSKFGNQAGCGATLIHEDILLTAGHCLRAFSGRGTYIGGSTNFGQDAAAEFHEDEIIVQHPNYNATNLHNDIMLVKLQTSSNFPAIQLNRDPERQIEGMAMTVIGFGNTVFQGDLSSNLMETQVQGYSFLDCFRVHLEKEATVSFDQSAQFCALGTEGRDSCDGDSGGPILMTEKDSLLQMGIISSGLGCGDDGIPAIYARISSYTEWIDEKICALSSNPPPGCTSSTLATGGSGSSGGGDIDATAETSMEVPTPNDGSSSSSPAFFTGNGQMSVQLGATALVLLAGFGLF